MAFKGLRKRGEIRLFAELEANRRLRHPELLDALGQIPCTSYERS
jgi:hypothetical protein